MLSKAVREALQVEREKAPAGEGKQTPMDPKARESQSGSSKRGGYNKDSSHWGAKTWEDGGRRERGPGQNRGPSPGARQTVPGGGGGCTPLPQRGLAWHIDSRHQGIRWAQ